MKAIKGLLRVATVVFVVLLGSGAAAAQAGSEDSLRGITRIQIVVERINGPAGSSFREGELDRRVQRILNDAGIATTPDSKVNEDERGNYLYLNLNSIPTNAGVAFNLVLQFKQVVVLLDGTRSVGATWDRAVIGTSSSGGFRTYAEEAVDDIVKDFVIDYLKANK